ncbi:hypothetical protein LEP48_17550 [Isoptericola sp. NEAU-Y5]|uniref:Flagellar protein FliT n=1 Tax=Isoptericola luteus TaxID=2879484 RepID=A0ABS7ZJD2_9MICO|nr:hypothetical protein [Isoptericola sp. NEAU-Y5]MCA5895139.1 hypothetical protein [Isoptericola sp. NEAU-Y5]
MSREAEADRDRWTAVLDELDAMAAGSVDLADEAMVARLCGWEPPLDLDRIPADLRPRALEVLDHLSDVVGRLRAQMADHRRQARALAEVPRTHDAGAAAYLDVCA